ncbi:MAG TPA: tRNA epoxyqueuosine(34) reductase QueG [Gammaproteobacteria bacterium]|nr:tRNA epoxyqueuosine(34) reductase QueG [Gammaproteobacteria bacterium]
MQNLAEKIRTEGRELGFQQIGISGVELEADEARLLAWLRDQRHGSMHYMARHGRRRSHPEQLVPGTVRIISARMDYWPEAEAAEKVLADGRRAYVSRYALGRDYHKVLRKRLKRLAEFIGGEAEQLGYRAFTDSAPVLERALARNAGLGWVGKHTNLVNRDAGSWFFLGEIYTDLPLPTDAPVGNHCGSCQACIDVCPTQAITSPYHLDARRCISYLTIENREAIPEEFRKAIGNRIYGCDDCQLVCPWNKFAHPTAEADFAPRHGLDNATLVELFGWDKATFLQRTEGSAIRRAGYEGWLRNCAVALGNAPSEPEVIAALEARRSYPSALVREHVEWALAQHQPQA